MNASGSLIDTTLPRFEGECRCCFQVFVSEKMASCAKVALHTVYVNIAFCFSRLCPLDRSVLGPQQGLRALETGNGTGLGRKIWLPKMARNDDR